MIKLLTEKYKYSVQLCMKEEENDVVRLIRDGKVIAENKNFQSNKNYNKYLELSNELVKNI